MTPTPAQLEAVDKIISSCLDTNASNEDIRQATMEIFAALTAAAEVGPRKSEHNHVYHGRGGRCIACDMTEAQVKAAAAEVGKLTPGMSKDEIITALNHHISNLEGELCALRAAEVGEPETEYAKGTIGWSLAVKRLQDNATIERCAQVAFKLYPPKGAKIAAAIRTLKDN